MSFSLVLICNVISITDQINQFLEHDYKTYAHFECNKEKLIFFPFRK